MNLITKDRLHVRWMIRMDLPQVLRIEQDCYNFPWEEPDFLRCLRQRNCIGITIERQGRIVGFMIYELHKSKLHLLNFAVDPAYRRQKIGSGMVSSLLRKLNTHRRTKITVAIRERNLPAQRFFHSCNFRAVKVLRNYYEDSHEDAFLFQFVLPTTADTLTNPVPEKV